MSKINRTVIFDMDNVLVCPSNHYLYLSKALDYYGYAMTEEDFYSCGAVPSKTRLSMLSERYGIPLTLHEKIIAKKYEMQLQDDNIEFNKNIQCIFKNLKDIGAKIAIVSNAKRVFVDRVMSLMDIAKYTDYSITPDELFSPKPSPALYLRCMSELGSSPLETIIVEDSEVGRTGAYLSGATVHGVNNWKSLNIDFPEYVKDTLNGTTVPYISSELNVVIPMAGQGSRFADVGYSNPKPLIDVNGVPMIQAVIENLNIKANYIFLVLDEHVKKYNIDKKLRSIVPNANIVIVPAITEGAACTMLHARHLINTDAPILLCNCDQIITWDSVHAMHSFEESDDDGHILTFKHTHPKWSYAKVGKDGYVNEVAEKKPISHNATTGHYYWKRGSDFVKYADEMIAKNKRVNNEFYVAPVFNEAIKDGKKIKIHNIDEMWGIGTPEDLDFYFREYRRD